MKIQSQINKFLSNSEIMERSGFCTWVFPQGRVERSSAYRSIDLSLLRAVHRDENTKTQWRQSWEPVMHNVPNSEFSDITFLARNWPYDILKLAKATNQVPLFLMPQSARCFLLSACHKPSAVGVWDFWDSFLRNTSYLLLDGFCNNFSSSCWWRVRNFREIF